MSGLQSSATRRAAAVLAVGACLALAGCSGKPSSPPPGGPTGGKAEKARREAEALAVGAVDAAATAQTRANPDLAVKRGWFGGRIAIQGRTVTIGAPQPVPPKGGPPAPPPVPDPPVVVSAAPAPRETLRPGSTAPMVRERVVSTIPHPTEAEAELDALAVACEAIERKLAALDPPVRHRPTPNEVRTEFVRKDSRTARPPDAEEEKALAQYDVTGKQVYVEFDVEVTAEQVRELRTQERVGGGVRLLGVLTAVALAGFLFLRADEWTRGYLTSWLALGAVALAGGAAAVFVFV